MHNNTPKRWSLIPRQDGNKYSVDNNKVSPPIDPGLAELNTAPNSPTAIWASSQVTDGQGSGTFNDPYSFRGAVYTAGHSDEVILKDDGVYQLTNSMWTSSDYDDRTYPDTPWTSTDVSNPSGANPRLVEYNMTVPTQESERITIRGEQFTTPTLDAQNGTLLHLDDSPYLSFTAFKVINAKAAFLVGDKRSDSRYIYFDLIDGKMSAWGDNVGLIRVKNNVGDHGKITRSIIEGPGLVSEGIHGNTACIYMRWNNHYTIDQVTLHNAPLGLYFKHPNDPSQADDGVPTLDYSNMYIYNTDRNGGNNWSCNGANFDNCIINGAYIGNTGGLGQNDVTGGNNNTFSNTTILGSLSYDPDTEPSVGEAAANGNALIDSIVGSYVNWGSANTLTTTSTSDYNLYENDAVMYQGQSVPLATWKAGSTPAGQDVNSLGGPATFVSQSPSNPEDYKLDSSSLGYGAGSNGEDMGADTSTVGVPV